MKKLIFLFVILCSSMSAQTYHSLQAIYTPDDNGQPDFIHRVVKDYECYWIFTPTKVINTYENKADVYTLIGFIEKDESLSYTVKAINGETLIISIWPKSQIIKVEFYEILVSRKNIPYCITYSIND